MNGVDDWICSTDRKVHQRRLNRLVRDLNKNIENDDLWRGRFFIRQHSAEFEKYEDGSGGNLYVYLRFYDKKDMKYQEFYGDSCSLCHFGGSRLWLTMNSFITEISSAWKDGNSPYKEDKSAYISISRDETVKRAAPYCGWPLAARW